MHKEAYMPSIAAAAKQCYLFSSCNLILPHYIKWSRFCILLNLVIFYSICSLLLICYERLHCQINTENYFGKIINILQLQKTHSLKLRANRLPGKSNNTETTEFIQKTELAPNQRKVTRQLNQRKALYKPILPGDRAIVGLTVRVLLPFILQWTDITFSKACRYFSCSILLEDSKEAGARATRRTEYIRKEKYNL